MFDHLLGILSVYTVRYDIDIHFHCIRSFPNRNIAPRQHLHRNNQYVRRKSLTSRDTCLMCHDHILNAFNTSKELHYLGYPCKSFLSNVFGIIFSNVNIVRRRKEYSYRGPNYGFVQLK